MQTIGGRGIHVVECEGVGDLLSTELANLILFVERELNSSELVSNRKSVEFVVHQNKHSFIFIYFNN